jgi:hypothetical protein
VWLNVVLQRRRITITIRIIIIIITTRTDIGHLMLVSLHPRAHRILKTAMERGGLARK